MQQAALCIVLAVAIPAFGRNAVAGDDGPVVSVADTASGHAFEILQSLEAARADLQRGEFHATGWILRSADDEESIPCELYCAFDRPGGSLRFDTRGADLVSVGPAPALTPELLEQMKH
jgi:hypothetical protein